ncbi:3'(2'),5'-bisphosphate nucleotidase CysQ family protein [Pantanalinema rosaneae CENA516]|uniref:3'(2'),5'-bisphosphate nucleotidase CysQ family protein n=1 Tax=Pantanalinema rosaneae TaxID=1620701 RepID=UPI003D6FE5A9
MGKMGEIGRMTEPELRELLAIARSVAWGAADILRSMAAATVNPHNTETDPVTAADTAADEYILTALQGRLGTEQFAYLTEESYKQQDSSDRLQCPWVWVIDPLDGTKDYIQGTGEYAVHIALVHQHRPIVAVVACPGVDTIYAAALGQGTQIEHRDGSTTPAHVSEIDRVEDLVLVTSRSHRNDRFNQLMQRFPSQKQRFLGSLGGKLAAIADRRADAYVALSGKSAPKDWDLAAPDLILSEAGGLLTHFDGTPLRYNQTDVVQWGGLIASNGHCHAELCAAATQILAEIDAASR